MNRQIFDIVRLQQSFGPRRKSFPYSQPQLHRRRPMSLFMPVGNKSEDLCMKSKVHLKDANPIDMDLTTKSSMSKEV